MGRGNHPKKPPPTPLIIPGCHWHDASTMAHLPRPLIGVKEIDKWGVGDWYMTLHITNPLTVLFNVAIHFCFHTRVYKTKKYLPTMGGGYPPPAPSLCPPPPTPRGQILTAPTVTGIAKGTRAHTPPPPPPNIVGSEKFERGGKCRDSLYHFT